MITGGERRERPRGVVFYERRPISAERAEDLDTARLVTRIQANGQEEFAALYERYFDRVYAYLRVSFKDSHQAEDVAQQAFMRVFEKIHTYERRSQPFRAWLFTIVRNLAVTQLKDRGRIEVVDPVEINDRRADLGAEPLGIDPFAVISDADLLVFLERLPLAQRQALLLKFMLGMTSPEIATVMDRNESDVRMLQHRGLEFLRKRLTAIGRRPDPRRRNRTIRRLVPRGRVMRARRYALH